MAVRLQTPLLDYCADTLDASGARQPPSIVPRTEARQCWLVRLIFSQMRVSKHDTSTPGNRLRSAALFFHRPAPPSDHRFCWHSLAVRTNVAPASWGGISPRSTATLRLIRQAFSSKERKSLGLIRVNDYTKSMRRKPLMSFLALLTTRNFSPAGFKWPRTRPPYSLIEPLRTANRTAGSRTSQLWIHLVHFGELHDPAFRRRHVRA